MIKIGITGQDGFIGSHLFNLVKTKDWCECVTFKDEYFTDTAKLNKFVKQCDVLVHLAAVNRCEDEKELYQTNISLVQDIINAMELEEATPYVIFSSSVQEERDNLYGNSKREGRYLFEQWAKKNNAKFSGLLIPNVFGPFGKPFYNSFIATFCYQLINGQETHIDKDSLVKLIYVGSICDYILTLIKEQNMPATCIKVPYDFEITVSEILNIFKKFRTDYIEYGIIPKLDNQNEINLFNTFTAYLNLKDYYPRKFLKHSDDRGVFFEIMKTNIGGQVSFSTTKPGVTRGNHYHTRKIERFAVINGKAAIELRRIGTDNKLVFELDGNTPAYIDIPVWYTHNIKNTGNSDLYTMFYINEFFNPNDTDTFFEGV